MSTAFNDILRLFSPSQAAAVMSKATVFYAQVGRRRAFQSWGDAASYEAGYLAFRDGQAPPTLKTPFADGWNDAAAVWDGKAEHDLGLDGDDGVPA